MKNEKIDYKKIIEFLKTPRGRAVAFFSFYFFFFLVIAILARANGSNSNKEDKDVITYPFSIESISNNNYRFKYEVSLDNNKFIYEGDKLAEKEKFKFNNESYYRKFNDFMKNNNGVWVKSDNPYLMSEYLDISNISLMLDNATYISKTDYESGIKTYNYEISTTTLVKLIDNLNIDIDDVSNTIYIKTDENDVVDEIDFSIDSYCSYKNIATNCSVNLKYFDFSKIEYIEDVE